MTKQEIFSVVFPLSLFLIGFSLIIFGFFVVLKNANIDRDLDLSVKVQVAVATITGCIFLLYGLGVLARKAGDVKLYPRYITSILCFIASIERQMPKGY